MPRRSSRTLQPLVILLGMSVALAACEQGKPRHPPPDPMVAGPPPVEEAPLPPALSQKLPKRPGQPIFTLDHAGAAFDPFGKPPAITPRDRPVVFDGFGFDAVAMKPGRGVDITVDGKLYGTVYGGPRQDVADHFKRPDMAAVGFRTVLPTGTHSVGPHTATVRVIAADGGGYYETPAVSFTVK